MSGLPNRKSGSQTVIVYESKIQILKYIVITFKYKRLSIWSNHTVWEGRKLVSLLNLKIYYRDGTVQDPSAKKEEVLPPTKRADNCQNTVYNKFSPGSIHKE